MGLEVPILRVRQTNWAPADDGRIADWISEFHQVDGLRASSFSMVVRRIR